MTLIDEFLEVKKGISPIVVRPSVDINWTYPLFWFVSYAHSDDRGEDAGKVSALVAAIKAEYARRIGAPLSVFSDTEAIRAMDDWEARILTGLRQSKMMVAVLSPAYPASEYCRKEWEIYVETELAHALPGEGIKPIYVVKHPAFEVVGVFMAEHRSVSYRQLLEHLEREGIMVLEEQVGLEAAGGKIRHAETCIARLLEPTLGSLKPEELRAVEYAAFLPPDNVPIRWLRDLLLADFPALAQTGLIDPIATVLQRLARLRLIVPLEHERDRARPSGGSGLGPHGPDSPAGARRRAGKARPWRSNGARAGGPSARGPPRHLAEEPLGPARPGLGAAAAARAGAAANRPRRPRGLCSGGYDWDSALAHRSHAQRPRPVAPKRGHVRAALQRRTGQRRLRSRRLGLVLADGPACRRLGST